MRKIGLELNERKTKVVSVKEGYFDFLGYRFGKTFSAKRKCLYIGTRPSPKAVQKICKTISAETEMWTKQQSLEEKVKYINQHLVGWGNYFSLGRRVSPAYDAVDKHTRFRLRYWLRRKHKVKGSGIGRFPDKFLYQEAGVVYLTKQTRNFPWAKT